MFNFELFLSIFNRQKKKQKGGFKFKMNFIKFKSVQQKNPKANRLHFFSNISDQFLVLDDLTFTLSLDHSLIIFVYFSYFQLFEASRL